MVCDVCGEQSAVIQVQEIVAGKQTSLRLCANCAATQHYRFSSIAEGTMKKLLESVSELATKLSDAQEDATVCTNCGLDSSTLRNTGLTGCPSCYAVFKDQLTRDYPDLADQLTAAAVPSATTYSAPAAAPQPTLAQQLKRAIIEERYEDAAQLRDQIQQSLKQDES